MRSLEALLAVLESAQTGQAEHVEAIPDRGCELNRIGPSTRYGARREGDGDPQVGRAAQTEEGRSQPDAAAEQVVPDRQRGQSRVRATEHRLDRERDGDATQDEPDAGQEGHGGGDRTGGQRTLRARARVLGAVGPVVQRHGAVVDPQRGQDEPTQMGVRPNTSRTEHETRQDVDHRGRCQRQTEQASPVQGLGRGHGILERVRLSPRPG